MAMENFEDVYDIVQKEYETTAQFLFRKDIYDTIFKDTKDKKKALIYSNIWINILSMNCDYPKNILDAIEKYRPKNNIYSK